jgi:hypothetical protein
MDVALGDCVSDREQCAAAQQLSALSVNGAHHDTAALQALPELAKLTDGQVKADPYRATHRQLSTDWKKNSDRNWISPRDHNITMTTRRGLFAQGGHAASGKQCERYDTQAAAKISQLLSLSRLCELPACLPHQFNRPSFPPPQRA